MRDLTPSAGERIVTISDRDPHQVVVNVVLALRSLMQERVTRHDLSDPASLVSFQAEGESVADLIRHLVNDVVAAIADSPTVVVDVELANMLRTDQGLRAWGHVMFGSRPRHQTLPKIYVESEPRIIDSGDTEIRLIVLQAPLSVTEAPSSGTSDGASR